MGMRIRTERGLKGEETRRLQNNLVLLRRWRPRRLPRQRNRIQMRRSRAERESTRFVEA